jgi:DNA-binding LacI/PurR family transcriptional regulator
MKEKHGKIKLADVAQKAGVSPATVSRIMNGRVQVSPETRERVVEAARRLGFDLEAEKKSRIIAFILSNRTVLHSFHSAVLMGAEDYCAAHDYGLLFLSLSYSIGLRGSDLALPEILQSRRAVSGVIVAGTNSPELLNLLTLRNMPWVALGNNIVGDTQALDGRMVHFDDLGGAYDLTRYLLSLGHQHIAFIGDLGLPWYARRFKGYCRAMEEAGLSVLSNDLTPRQPEEMGYVATRRMLQQRPSLTAAIAGDDSIAQGVYRAIRDSGLSIPRDMSVAGFNDSIEAVLLDPPLTSVRVFPDELGRHLAEALLMQLQVSGQDFGVIILPTQLVRRGSCASVG